MFEQLSPDKRTLRVSNWSLFGQFLWLFRIFSKIHIIFLKNLPRARTPRPPWTSPRPSGVRPRKWGRAMLRASVYAKRFKSIEIQHRAGFWSYKLALKFWRWLYPRVTSNQRFSDFWLEFLWFSLLYLWFGTSRDTRKSKEIIGNHRKQSQKITKSLIARHSRI